VGAGRLRWWSSGESRSDLNSRLHEQWQKEQGEKGFLPQSERWPTIQSEDLSFSPPVSTMAVMNKWFDETYEKPVEHPRWYGQRWISGNFDVVSCPHVPEGTSYLFQGEFNCALCAKEKAMAEWKCPRCHTMNGGESCAGCDWKPGATGGVNHINYCSPWGIVPVRPVPMERNTILVVGAGGSAWTKRINDSSPLPGRIDEALKGYRDTFGYVREVQLDVATFERFERIVRNTTLVPKPPPPMPEQAEVTIGRKFLDQMQRLMQGTEHDGAFSDGQFEERVTELLEMESMVNGNSVLVQDRPLSPEELRDLTGVNSGVRCGPRATDDSHDSETAQRLAAIINAPPSVAGRVDLAEYLIKEEHIGMAECLSVLETGRLPEEKEAVTLTSPTGEKLTMHFPKERDMATSSKMTIEEYRKEYGEPKHVGEDVFCKCCGQKAERTFGPAPYECRMGLRPNIEGWMKVFFPIRTTFEGEMQESFDVCTSCAKKVSDYIVYVGKEKSGETGLSDEDLLADDA
jgi:hypothetical protein